MHYKTTPGCKPKQSKQIHQKMDWRAQSPGEVPEAAPATRVASDSIFSFGLREVCPFPLHTFLKALLLPEVQDDHPNLTPVQWPLLGTGTHTLKLAPEFSGLLCSDTEVAAPCLMCQLLVNTAGDAEKKACLETPTNYYYLYTGSLWRKWAFLALSLKQRELGSLHFSS